MLSSSSTSTSTYTPGAIHWLPTRNEIPIQHLHATNIDPGCFNHPVLILSVSPSGTEAVVLLITSFAGTDLLKRHPHDLRARSLHLPIYPSNIHPDNHCLLFLRDDARLPRNSYVKIEPQRTVQTVLLRPTRHAECCLTAQSYGELVRRIGFQAPKTSPVGARQMRLAGQRQNKHRSQSLVAQNPLGSGDAYAQYRYLVLPREAARLPVAVTVTERTPLLQHVRPLSNIAYGSMRRNASEARGGCDVGSFFMVVVALGMFGLWVWFRR